MTPSTMRACLALLAVSLAAACVDQGPGDQGQRIDPGYVQANLLDAPPTTLTRRFDAELRGADGKVKVIYLGNEAPTAPLVPGDKVTVVHYWQVVEPPGPQWRVFAHVRGDANAFMNVDLTDMRTGYGPARWKAGDVIRDEQIFVLRKDWPSATARLVVGMYPKGGHRLEDRLEIVVGGAAVADRALEVGAFAVDLAKAPPPPGTLVLKQATGPIVIDGKADEPAWKTAAVQPAFASAEGCPELKDRTDGKMLWDDQFLYVFVEVDDADVHSPYTQTDDPLWQHDVVELFIDGDGNQKGYVELQVNPRNAHFDTWFAGTRAGPPRDDTFSAQMVTQVVVKGTLDRRDDGDSGWDVEIAVPWAAVKGKDAAMKFPVPPPVGTKLRLNVVRVDVTGEGDGKRTFAASWNRISCEDFHALGKMLDVVLADSAGSVEPQAGGGAGAGAGTVTGTGTGTGVGAGAGAGAGAGTGVGAGVGTGAGAGVGTGAGAGTATGTAASAPRIQPRTPPAQPLTEPAPPKPQ